MGLEEALISLSAALFIGLNLGLAIRLTTEGITLKDLPRAFYLAVKLIFVYPIVLPVVLVRNKSAEGMHRGNPCLLWVAFIIRIFRGYGWYEFLDVVILGIKRVIANNQDESKLILLYFPSECKVKS